MAVNDREKAANERIARLYRDTAHEEPPSRLDHAIYGAARASGPSRVSRVQTWWSSWRLPFVLAAVGVVSVSLVTLVLEEGGERLTDGPQRPVAKQEAPAGRAAPPPGAGSVPAEERVQRDSPPPSAADGPDVAADRNAAPAVSATPPPPAGVPMRKSESASRPRAEAASEIAELDGEPAAVWLERIAVLRREGRDSEADALLAELKVRFPGATLPPQRQ